MGYFGIGHEPPPHPDPNSCEGEFYVFYFIPGVMKLIITPATVEAMPMRREKSLFDRARLILLL